MRGRLQGLRPRHHDHLHDVMHLEGRALNAAAAGAAHFALSTLDSSADQYAAGVKYHFSPFVSWYLVGSYLRNGPGAHYCMGVSGHGHGVCGRDANNNVVAGDKAKVVTTGMTFDF
jgi:hypothetical protein